MNMTMWSIFQVLKVSQLSKTEFSVSIQAQSPACFVWLVAKDVRGRFSENGFLLTEPTKVVCNYVYILRVKFDVDSSIKVSNNEQLATFSIKRLSERDNPLNEVVLWQFCCILPKLQKILEYVSLLKYMEYIGELALIGLTNGQQTD